jgi:hypothetical protein
VAREGAGRLGRRGLERHLTGARPGQRDVDVDPRIVARRHRAARGERRDAVSASRLQPVALQIELDRGPLERTAQCGVRRRAPGDPRVEVGKARRGQRYRERIAGTAEAAVRDQPVRADAQAGVEVVHLGRRGGEPAVAGERDVAPAALAHVEARIDRPPRRERAGCGDVPGDPRARVGTERRRVEALELRARIERLLPGEADRSRGGDRPAARGRDEALHRERIPAACALELEADVRLREPRIDRLRVGGDRRGDRTVEARRAERAMEGLEVEALDGEVERRAPGSRARAAGRASARAEPGVERAQRQRAVAPGEGRRRLDERHLAVGQWTRCGILRVEPAGDRAVLPARRLRFERKRGTRPVRVEPGEIERGEPELGVGEPARCERRDAHGSTGIRARGLAAERDLELLEAAGDGRLERGRQPRIVADERRGAARRERARGTERDFP